MHVIQVGYTSSRTARRSAGLSGAASGPPSAEAELELAPVALPANHGAKVAQAVRPERDHRGRGCISPGLVAGVYDARHTPSASKVTAAAPLPRTTATSTRAAARARGTRRRPRRSLVQRPSRAARVRANAQKTVPGRAGRPRRARRSDHHQIHRPGRPSDPSQHVRRAAAPRGPLLERLAPAHARVSLNGPRFKARPTLPKGPRRDRWPSWRRQALPKRRSRA